ncbi:serine hydrolase domain-containing protein [Maricaulis maris]|uniref:serine hydrolase domain-containing protein n=1 Tax=Maricaulis maris TaxID=74318 RepID=UPI003B8E4B2F
MFKPLVWAAVAQLGLSPMAIAQSADLEAALAAVQESIDHPGFSGAITILVEGQPVLSEARGFADQDAGRANTLDTRFNIASVGKFLTAMTYVRTIRNQDPGGADFRDLEVRALLPEQAMAFSSDVTAGDLLAHRTRIESFMEAPGAMTRIVEAGSNDDVFEMVRAAQPVPIARRWDGLAYNNANAVVMGAAVARLTGLTYEDALDEIVLSPAGVNDASFARLADYRAENLALPYVEATFDGTNERQSGAAQPLATVYPRRFESPLTLMTPSAAGGLYMTAPGLASVGAAALDGRVLERAELAQMCESILPIPGRILGYGCSGRELAPDVVRWGHGGGAPGVGAELAIYPDLDIVVAIVANHNGRATPVLAAFEAALVPQEARETEAGGFVIREH